MVRNRIFDDNPKQREPSYTIDYYASWFLTIVCFVIAIAVIFIEFDIDTRPGNHRDLAVRIIASFLSSLSSSPNGKALAFCIFLSLGFGCYFSVDRSKKKMLRQQAEWAKQDMD